MNWVDITILVLLGLGGVLGLLSGLLWQIARLVIFGVSVYTTLYYHGPAGDFLAQTLGITDPTITKGLAYFFTFVATYLVLFLLTHLIERFVRAMKLKWMDRLLGAGLGMLKAALICVVLLLGVAIIPVKSVQPDVEVSHLAPPLLLGVRAMSLAVPEEQQKQVTAWFEDMKGQAEKHIEKKVEEAERDVVEEAVKRAIEGSKNREAGKKEATPPRSR